MIDVLNPTNYERTDAELEEWFVFCVCVAGKTAYTTALNVDRFLERLRWAFPGETLWDSLHEPGCDWHWLFSNMQANSLGQYNRVTNALITAADIRLDLRRCSVEQLEDIPGIGPKTSRFFLVHSRPDQRLAVIDTHMLKHLYALGIWPNPQYRPSGFRYRMLEAIVLDFADHAGISPAEYDIQIWRAYNGNDPEAISNLLRRDHSYQGGLVRFPRR